jgi:type VI secretion system protein ImpK
VLLTIYIGLRFFLADISGPALDRLGALGHEKPAPVIVTAEPTPTLTETNPTTHTMPDEPRPEPLVPPGPTEGVNLAGQLGTFLQPEIDARLISVMDSPTQITIRITGSGLFAPGSDQLAPAYVATFQRIRTAIAEHQQDIPGDLIVVGHTDNVPLKRSLRFQDNYDLSRARAESVARILAEDKRITSKIEKDGRGPSEPVSGGDPATGNDTQEKRDKNRRVEILIEK